MKAFQMGDAGPLLRPHPSVARRPRPASNELDQLRAMVDQLQEENHALRGEITRLRLFQAIELSEEEDADDPLPDDARKLYVVLPQVFSQIAFFKIAHDLGFSIPRSQKIIGILQRQRFIERAGEELRKTDPFQYRIPFEKRPKSA